MSFPIYPISNLIIRLSQLNAAQFPNPDEPSEACLYQNDVSPDPNMTEDTFVKADFTGYVDKTLTMVSPSMNDQGLVTSRSNLLHWSTPGGGSVAPQTIYGVFIVNFDGQVIAAQRFDEPQTVGGSLPQAISGVWRTSEPLSSYGWLDAES